MAFNISLVILLVIFFLSLSGIKGFFKAFLIFIVTVPLLGAMPSETVFFNGTPVRFGAIFFLVFLFFYSKRIKFIGFGPFRKYFIFIIIALVSSIFSNYPLVSSLRSFTFLQIGILFYLSAIVSYNFEDGFQKINKSIFYGLVLVLIVASIEFVTQNSSLYSLGLTVQDTNKYLEDIRTFSGRISSTLGQPVYFAVYLLVILPLVNSFDFFNNKFILVTIQLLIVFFIYISGTRAALPVLLLGGGLYLIKTGQYRKLIFIIISLSFLLLTFSHFFGGQIFYWERSFDLSKLSTENANAFQRLELSERLFSIFKTHSFLGMGPGIIQKLSLGSRLSYNISFEGLGGLENHYLVILADTGILGFIIYLLFVIDIFKFLGKKSMKILNMKIYKYQINMFYSVTFFLMISLTVSNLTSIPMAILAILLGNLFGKSEKIIKSNAE